MKVKMSSVTFFPITWFEDRNWKSIQVFGRLENTRSIYLRIGFKPYFTVRYEDVDLELIDDNHQFLLSETPVANIEELSTNLYRIYTLDKDDYYNSVRFYEQNGLGEIVDQNQDIKSKFFTYRKLFPGSWQRATGLKTLAYNVTTNKHYSAADLEYYTNNIVSIEYDAAIPKSIVGYFDIEAIPADDVSFPDAHEAEPPDIIFAISLIVSNGENTRNLLYIVTDTQLPTNYVTNATRTGKKYNVTIFKASTEKEMLQQFYQGLMDYRVDRLVSYNGRRFDINYLGSRTRKYDIQLPAFTKILDFDPYYYPSTIVQKKPFPIVEDVYKLKTPGISQIDLLDFYRRIYPQLGNHKLETIGSLVVKRGKTGLTIPELFAKYRAGTPEGLLEIIDYSVFDSILLKELWDASNIDQQLASMANLWKNDAEYVLTTSMEKLFDDLVRYLTPNAPTDKFKVGKVLTTQRKSGIHRNVYLYSLSNVYLTFLEQLNDPLANVIVEYFKDTDLGIVPFKSGYFPVSFKQVQNFLKDELYNPVWIEENQLAIQTELDLDMFVILDYLPLVIVANKSWVLVNDAGLIFKKGMSSFVRPPFKLLEKYADYLINFLLKNPQATAANIKFPQFDTTLQDYVMDTKVTAENYSDPPNGKENIIQQMMEMDLPVTRSWRRVEYIQTNQGPVISEIYNQDPNKYFNDLDQTYYNRKLQIALSPVLK